jgi:hypothetical protein
MALRLLLLTCVAAIGVLGSAASSLALAGMSVSSGLCALRAALSGCSEAGATAAGLAAASVALLGLGGFSSCARTLAFLLAAALALLHAWLAAPSPQVWAAAASQLHADPRLREMVRAGVLPQCSVDGARDALLLLSALRHVAATWAWLVREAGAGAWLLREAGARAAVAAAAARAEGEGAEGGEGEGAAMLRRVLGM